MESFEVIHSVIVKVEAETVHEAAAIAGKSIASLPGIVAWNLLCGRPPKIREGELIVQGEVYVRRQPVAQGGRQ